MRTADPKFLIFGSDSGNQRELAGLLGELGHNPDHTSDPLEAHRLLMDGGYDCILVDRDIHPTWSSIVASRISTEKPPLVFLTGPAGSTAPPAPVVGLADGYLPLSRDSVYGLARHVRTAVARLSKSRLTERMEESGTSSFAHPANCEDCFSDSRIIVRTSRITNHGPTEDFSFVTSCGNGRYAVLLGDLTGPHELRDLAMIHLRSRIEGYMVESPAPSKLMEELNRDLVHAGNSIEFVAAVAVFLDLKRKLLACSAAGHQPPYYRRWGSVQWRALGENGIPLGVRCGETYRQYERRLGPGDKVLLMSDGILKIKGADGGFQTLDSAIRAMDMFPVDAAPTEILEGIGDLVTSAVNGGSVSDEITSILIQV